MKKRTASSRGSPGRATPSSAAAAAAASGRRPTKKVAFATSLEKMLAPIGCGGRAPLVALQGDSVADQHPGQQQPAGNSGGSGSNAIPAQHFVQSPITTAGYHRRKHGGLSPPGGTPCSSLCDSDGTASTLATSQLRFGLSSGGGGGSSGHGLATFGSAPSESFEQAAGEPSASIGWPMHPPPARAPQASQLYHPSGNDQQHIKQWQQDEEVLEDSAAASDFVSDARGLWRSACAPSGGAHVHARQKELYCDDDGEAEVESSAAVAAAAVAVHAAPIGLQGARGALCAAPARDAMDDPEVWQDPQLQLHAPNAVSGGGGGGGPALPAQQAQHDVRGRQEEEERERQRGRATRVAGLPPPAWYDASSQPPGDKAACWPPWELSPPWHDALEAPGRPCAGWGWGWAASPGSGGRLCGEALQQAAEYERMTAGGGSTPGSATEYEPAQLPHELDVEE